MAIIEFTDGKYVGRVRNGKPHGKGAYHYSTGDVYEGVFKDGKKHGKGIWKYKSGAITKCNYVGDKLNGPAKRIEKDVISHGKFLDDKRHGEWIYKYKNGFRKRRIYDNGKEVKIKENVNKKWRIGTIDYQECKYRGRLVNGVKEGKGVIDFNDGGYLKTQFKKGKMYGPSVRYWPDGRQIEGTIKNNGFYGQVRYFSEGKKRLYVGKWKKDDAHGYGESTCEEFTYVGYYKNGQPHGKGVFTYNINNEKFEGSFKKGLKHGVFTRTFIKNGVTYVDVGPWKNNLMVGKHKFTDNYGNKVICGHNKNGLRHGKAVFYYANGTIQIDVYKNGELINSYELK